MQKLANISAFEGLQGQANRSMGAVSDVAVFNGLFTNDIVKKVEEAIDGEHGSVYEDVDFLAEQVGKWIGFKAFNMGSFKSHTKMPNEYSNSYFGSCTEKERQRFLMRECEDAASAIEAFLGRGVDKYRLFTFALENAVGHKYAPGDEYNAWRAIRYDDSDPVAEYGG